MQSVGDDLISVDVVDTQTASQLAVRLRRGSDWLDVVAGIDSVVARFDSAVITRGTAEDRMDALLVAVIDEPEIAAGDREVPIVEVPIAYGGEHGPDFDAVCESLGLTRNQFMGMHCGEYTVDLIGFIPGFAYVGGLDAKLDVPRRTEPRIHVAAGSVGIADRRTGLYSLPGPGGWSIIGRTDFALFDANAENPFALEAGSRVRFVAIERQ